MYNTNSLEDQEMDAWAKSELERMVNNLLFAKAFWQYVKYEWLPKSGMWVVGYRNLLYVGKNKNATIENYHVNLKANLCSSKGRTIDRWNTCAIWLCIAAILV